MPVFRAAFAKPDKDSVEPAIELTDHQRLPPVRHLAGPPTAACGVLSAGVEAGRHLAGRPRADVADGGPRRVDRVWAGARGARRRSAPSRSCEEQEFDGQEMPQHLQPSGCGAGPCHVRDSRGVGREHPQGNGTQGLAQWNQGTDPTGIHISHGDPGLPEPLNAITIRISCSSVGP